jgi:hypothetical protein
VINQCFGGSQVPWNVWGPHLGCWYNSVGAVGYVGNVYNPGNSLQPAAAYPYIPSYGTVFQQTYGTASNPFQLFLSAQIKL